MSLDSVIRETIKNVKPEDEDVIIKKLLLELSKEIHREVKKSILANIKGINKKVDKIDIEGIIAFTTPNIQIQKDRNKNNVNVQLLENTYTRFEDYSSNPDWEQRYWVNKQYGSFFKDAISKELQQDRIELGSFCLYYLHVREGDHTRFDIDQPFRIFLDEKKCDVLPVKVNYKKSKRLFGKAEIIVTDGVGYKKHYDEFAVPSPDFIGIPFSYTLNI